MSVSVVYRPLVSWPGALTEERESSPFSADWRVTLDLLDREVFHLGGSEVVIEVALGERNFRAGGSLVGNHPLPAHPGVVVSFEAKTLGPLRYWTDKYEAPTWRGDERLGWRHNVRAVALALEALRKVERYGVANRGEQYVGWKQLGAGTPLGPPAPMTVDEAARILLVGADVAVTPAMIGDLVNGLDLPFVATLYRIAARQHHPDAGGNPDTFRKITEARDLLVSQQEGQ